MSQHDLNIDNQGFPGFRADLNNALQALGSLASGATAPTTTYAYQLWADTANDTLKIRNAANTAWIDLGIKLSTGGIQRLAEYAANGDFYTDSGTANAYVLSTVDAKLAPSSYTNGMRVRFIAGNANTGASTINIAGLGVKNLLTESGLALTSGYLRTDAITTAEYNGSDFIVSFDKSDSISGSATFTNSTNSIALTGVGGLYGLELGDVIKVEGSTSNDGEYTVEAITDANNVIVNQAHAGGTTSKSLVDEAATVTVKLLCKWYLAPTGLGQGWVAVTASRTLGATYTNNTGKSIQAVATVIQNVTGSLTRNFKVDGLAVNGATEITNGQVRTLGSVLIPSGSTYGVDSGTGVDLNRWLELR